MRTTRTPPMTTRSTIPRTTITSVIAIQTTLSTVQSLLRPGPAAAEDTTAEVVRSNSENVGSEQAEVTRRYNRMARIYDVYDAPMEMMGVKKLRRRLLKKASGSVLEVGVGTGRNLVHYGEGVEFTGIDVSSRMLAKARARLGLLPMDADLMEADVADLPFDDGMFDTVVSTCVFCSVADPVTGLRELGRVVQPGGRILFLEHVRPRNWFLGLLADAATILTRRVFGFRANRRTEENIADAGLEVVQIERNGVWRTIVARPGSTGRG